MQDYLKTPFYKIPEAHRAQAMIEALRELDIILILGREQRFIELLEPNTPHPVLRSGIDIRNGYYKPDMLNVYGFTHIKRTDDNRDHVSTFGLPERVNANVSAKKTPQVIARDIKRRVWPSYCEYREAMIARGKAAHADYKALEEAKAAYCERLELRTVSHLEHTVYGNGIDLELSYNGRPYKVEMSVSDLTRDDIMELLELFQERKEAAETRKKAEELGPPPVHFEQ